MTTFRTFMLALVASFAPSQEARHMAEARRMMRVARADKALGYHCAAKAAVQSALAYRAAAHAHRYYATR